MARIALFGGSFNPPHVAHQLACLFALETADVSEVWMVPAWKHPFEKALVAFEHRFEMCRLAALRIAGLSVSRVEADLGGDSRTLHTVKHLLAQRPGDSFTLVIGADLLAERRQWYGFSELEKLVDFCVLGRAGFDGPEPLLPAVSSTEIRERLARAEDCSRLVPRTVLAYIRTQGLYR
ncbi:MAG TPA: nicotinate (nicotinamide) nucleotide adenylyltransferase [Polyangia bacterium]|nr:nicotinate (nicotinamide) nucleotide adenylyltransferase [Polyangia bacterium]